jgi:hypothetical protein
MLMSKRSRTAVEVFKPNTLVEYKGGGYDGCWWEWNYAFFDSRGCFHDIASSGYKGCSTLAKLQEAFENRPDDFGFVDITNEEEVTAAADHWSVPAVVGISQWFQKRGVKFRLRPKCDCCSKRFDPCEGHGDCYSGDGGIVCTAKKIICETCWDAYSCSECGEYYGPGMRFMATEDYSHACSPCVRRYYEDEL